MKMRFLGCVLCLACSFALGCPAWAQDAPPVDMKMLLATLKQIKEQRSTSQKSLEARALQDFRNAASSNAAAIAFYQNAVAVTGGDTKKAQDLAKSEAVQNAARLHLNYLVLTIERASGATTKQLEPALQAHIAGLIAAGAGDPAIQVRREEGAKGGYAPSGRKRVPSNEPMFWEQELIRQGVDTSVFVQWYGIQRMIEGAKDWEPCPGNPDGMYQTTLLPYYRQKKDPQAIAYWESKMQQEAQRASNSKDAVKIDRFNTVRRAQLLWSRAGEYALIGQHNRAMNEMLTVVKSFPAHPDLADWIGQMEGMIGGGTPGANTTASSAAGNPAPTQPNPQPESPANN